MIKPFFTLLFIVFTTALTAQATKYLFYLHGRIVEIQGANAVETTNGYGPYKYNDILDTLRGRGFKVISEVRPPETQVKPYAGKIAGEIRNLIASGVSPADITVLGASKGALIAMELSAMLMIREINFVLMGACSGREIEDAGLYGNILSIYEKSDDPGSCGPPGKVSRGVTHYKEVQIDTGLRHGFLYRPLGAWVEPASRWAMGEYK
jgi:hypothetical protein